jgi:hypothetical protein
MRNHSSILSKNDSKWYPVWDISSCERPNDCILCAQYGARCTKRRIKPSHKLNAINRRYAREMTTIAFPIDILRRLNSQITAFYA